MPWEWLSVEDAIQFVEAAKKVERKRAKLLLAEAALAGKVRTQGLVGEEWYSIEPERWKAAFHEWLHYHSFGDFFAIEFQADHLDAWFLTRADAPAEESPMERTRGRKSKVDWNEIAGEAFRRVYVNALPPDNDQAFARELLSWCQEQYGKEVSDSVMRENIRKWLLPLRKELGRL